MKMELHRLFMNMPSNSTESFWTGFISALLIPHFPLYSTQKSSGSKYSVRRITVECDLTRGFEFLNCWPVIIFLLAGTEIQLYILL